ncbi:hypothetical protein, partial [Nocardia abscessus]|uniref:hypothetical protein n=1 Tax=Nocardia abscessus TaxID=120957 RepID=UPI002455C3C7
MNLQRLRRCVFAAPWWGGGGRRRGEGVQPVRREERGVGVTGEERRMTQHAHQQVPVGDQAVDLRPVQG